MAVDQVAIAKKLGISAKQVRDLLLSHGISVKASGGFNEELKTAIQAFQVKAVDYTGKPLAVDGIVGRHTLDALQRKGIPATPLGIDEIAWPPKNVEQAGPLARATLQIAFEQLQEWVRETNGHDAMRSKFREFVDVPANGDWCAAFVSWCLDRGKVASGATVFIPKTRGARSVLNDVFDNPSTRKYALKKASNPTPRCGDIIVWWRKSPDKNWEGHIGFVFDNDGVYVHTIEGNSGGELRHKRYQDPFDFPVAAKRGFLGLVRYP